MIIRPYIAQSGNFIVVNHLKNKKRQPSVMGILFIFGKKVEKIILITQDCLLQE